VPHRLPRDKLAAAVRSHWEHRYLQDHPEQAQTLLPKPDHRYDENKQAGQWINERVTASLNHLRATCQKCHNYDQQTEKTPAIDDKLADALLPDIAPVAIPRPWLEFAKFSHAAHRSTTLDGRTIRCADCHRGAEIDSASPAAELVNKENEKPLPMLPHRDVCLKCHSTKADGGARTDCAECHRFHDRVGHAMHAGE
jgi:hypothetical protein